MNYQKMNYQLSDDSATSADDRRFEIAAVKRIAEIEAVWRINAGSDTLLPLSQPEPQTPVLKLAA